MEQVKHKQTTLFTNLSEDSILFNKINPVNTSQSFHHYRCLKKLDNFSRQIILWKIWTRKKIQPHIISEATPHKNKQQATEWIFKCVEKYICSSLNKLPSSSFQDVKKLDMEENIIQVLSILMFPLQDKVQYFWLWN